jgi:chemotaxis family two-component system response regulator Rcp1
MPLVPLQVLLDEDSTGDVRLAQEIFRDVNMSIRLHMASDSAPCPDLILLDLNLPKMDGREALAHIEQDDKPKRIPIVILNSCSEAKVDIVKSHQCEADSYLSKPAQLDTFESLVKSINDFELTRAKLPQQRKRG